MGQAPTRIINIFLNFVFFVFMLLVLVVVHVSKKITKKGKGMGGWCLANPSLSGFLNFF